MATQPFGGGKHPRQRENAFGPAHPDQPRRGQTESSVEREIGRQPGDRDRKQPSERLGVDQECGADPVEPGEEVAEAETPPGSPRSYRRAPASGGRAIPKPN